MAKKKSASLNTLDLHGFTEDEVDDAIDRFLCKEQQKGSSRVRIMPGKGKGIVKKAALDYLKRAGYHWQHEKMANGKTNEGVLVVFMD